MIRLIVADDHAIVRSGLRQIFAQTPDIVVVEEAINGVQVLERIRVDNFSLLLLDLNMDGISGADLIARVRAHRPDLPILVLSMHNEPQVAARAISAGANGYVGKDSNSDILLTAIRKVAAKGQYIAPDLAQRMVFDTQSTAHRPLHSLLSERELEIFRLLITGKSVTEIGAQLSISNKTVSTHKQRMMEKLHLSNMADLMRYAIANKV